MSAVWISSSSASVSDLAPGVEDRAVPDVGRDDGLEVVVREVGRDVGLDVDA